jgi:hypothetical protein
MRYNTPVNKNEMSQKKEAERATIVLNDLTDNITWRRQRGGMTTTIVDHIAKANFGFNGISKITEFPSIDGNT